jgi:hypothetical protein
LISEDQPTRKTRKQALADKPLVVHMSKALIGGLLRRWPALGRFR